MTIRDLIRFKLIQHSNEEYIFYEHRNLYFTLIKRKTYLLANFKSNPNISVKWYLQVAINNNRHRKKQIHHSIVPLP